jgi:hypothetical protein
MQVTGYWILDVRYWKLYQSTRFPLLPGGVSRGSEFFGAVLLTREGVVFGWILDVGFWILNAGCWIPEIDFINDCR